MGYNKPNPLKMMDSALKMYKAEKKGGMHRMESPMYAKAGSSEGMPRLEDRVKRRQDKVDESRATFGTKDVDQGFDRKLKRLKKSVAKSEERGMNLNYDATDASGVGYSRETSPMKRESAELKYMPIDDRASDDRIPDSGNLKQENNRIADSGTIEETSTPDSKNKPSSTRKPRKKGSPAKNMDHKGMSKKELHNHGMKEHPAKPPKKTPPPKAGEPKPNPNKYGKKSAELKDMPIVDIEKGDAKGSPAKAAKPDYIDIDKDGNTTESMKDAAKAKGSPAKNMNKGYGQEVKSPMKKRGVVGRAVKKAVQAYNPIGVIKKKSQGYNSRLDESLAKDGKESSKKQSMKDRRDESKGMEKSKGKGAYSSDPKIS